MFSYSPSKSVTFCTHFVSKEHLGCRSFCYTLCKTHTNQGRHPLVFHQSIISIWWNSRVMWFYPSMGNARLMSSILTSTKPPHFHQVKKKKSFNCINRNCFNSTTSFQLSWISSFWQKKKCAFRKVLINYKDVQNNYMSCLCSCSQSTSVSLNRQQIYSTPNSENLSVST